MSKMNEHYFKSLCFKVACYMVVDNQDMGRDMHVLEEMEAL